MFLVGFIIRICQHNPISFTRTCSFKSETNLIALNFIVCLKTDSCSLEYRYLTIVYVYRNKEANIVNKII